MSTKQIVLVPVDFSDPSRAAMAWAFDYARKLDCELHLLHVIDRVATAVTEKRKGERQAIVRAAEEELAKVAPDAELRERVRPVDRLVVWGKPADQITAVARSIGADLIVLGTHGRYGWKRAALGSVAEAVVRHAPCPVLTVKPSRES